LRSGRRRDRWCELGSRHMGGTLCERSQVPGQMSRLGNEILLRLARCPGGSSNMRVLGALEPAGVPMSRRFLTHSGLGSSHVSDSSQIHVRDGLGSGVSATPPDLEVCDDCDG
jgi:hypothetical protein